MKFVLGTKKAYDQNFLLTKANRIKILFFLEGKSLVSNYSKKNGQPKERPEPRGNDRQPTNENKKLPRVATRKSLVCKMVPMSTKIISSTRPPQL